ncbi:hypothetical protein BJ944DRAFT_269550 [Cunninghamella echinulata]|nr:hypothetical protein BJ944DRAFT_269550 [Cunninghamella echinulata]
MSSTKNVLKASPTTKHPSKSIHHPVSLHHKEINTVINSYPAPTSIPSNLLASINHQDSFSTSLSSAITTSSVNSINNKELPSPTPVLEQQPQGQQQKDKNDTPLIGGIVGGIIFILTSIFTMIYFIRKQKKKKRPNPHSSSSSSNQLLKEWQYNNKKKNNTKSWCSFDSSSSSLNKNNSPKNSIIDPPPPAYYALSMDSNTVTSKSLKRLTYDSNISKPSSITKQYHPQLAYSPSDHSILQMDHPTHHQNHNNGNISPSNTLVDTTNSWLYHKENHNHDQDDNDDFVSFKDEDEVDDLQQDEQQRRSIQPYQAQLDYSSPISDALIPPCSYADTLLHTNHSNSS